MQKRIFNLPRTVSALVHGTVLSALVAAAADVPGPAPAPADNPVPPAQQPAQPAQSGQPRPGRGQGGGGNNAGPGGGGNFQGGRGGGGNFGGGGVLDDKQRELLREATQSESDELRKLNDRLQAAQKELVHAVVAEKYDEKVVREKAEVVSKIQIEIMMLRAKAFATVSPTLRPDQREQLENSRIGIGMVMGGGGGGGIGGVGFAGGPGGGNGGGGFGPPATDRTFRRNAGGDNGGNVDPAQQQRRRGGQGQGQ